MAISDKTRKILWGRSGNRCAMCRRALVVDATDADAESVVGDECHVISGRPTGPRADPLYPPDALDDLANLLLLCRVHHKLVDDQSDTYTADILRNLRENHERWVASALSSKADPAPVRIRKIQGQTPTHLVRITSGRELFTIVDGALGFLFDHVDPSSAEEATLLRGFLQSAQDWGEISSDLEAGGKVDAAFDLMKQLQTLQEAGFWVFGGTERRRLEGGVGAPMTFPVALLRVVRADDPSISCVAGASGAHGGTAP